MDGVCQLDQNREVINLPPKLDVINLVWAVLERFILVIPFIKDVVLKLIFEGYDFRKVALNRFAFAKGLQTSAQGFERPCNRLS